MLRKYLQHHHIFQLKTSLFKFFDCAARVCQKYFWILVCPLALLKRCWLFETECLQQHAGRSKSSCLRQWHVLNLNSVILADNTTQEMQHLIITWVEILHFCFVKKTFNSPGDFPLWTHLFIIRTYTCHLQEAEFPSSQKDLPTAAPYSLTLLFSLSYWGSCFSSLNGTWTSQEIQFVSSFLLVSFPGLLIFQAASYPSLCYGTLEVSAVEACCKNQMFKVTGSHWVFVHESQWQLGREAFSNPHPKSFPGVCPSRAVLLLGLCGASCVISPDGCPPPCSIVSSLDSAKWVFYTTSQCFIKIMKK